MELSNHEYVGRALTLLASGLEPFVEQRLRPLVLPTMSWTDLIAKRDEISGKHGGTYETDDVQILLRALTESLGALHRPFDTDLGRSGARLASELRETRNGWAHSSSFSVEDAYRAADSVQRLLAIVGADEQANEAIQLRLVIHERIARPREGTHSGDIAPGLTSEEKVSAPGGDPMEPASTTAPETHGVETSRANDNSSHPPTSALQAFAVDVQITCTPIVSYAMAHNRLTVISEISLISESATVRGATLSVGIETASGPLGEPREYFVDIAAGSTTPINRLDITVDPGAMLTIEEARPARVIASLTHDGEVLGRADVPVTLLAAHQWLADPVLISLEMLAAHVQPNHPALAPLIQDAAAQLEVTTGSGALVGYQLGAERVDQTVDAIVRSIRQRDIRYSVPPASWTDDGQKIRTPDEVLESRIGTCLDTAVLLAASLERVGIRPILVVVTGHAFLGYWREEESLASPAMTSGGATAALVNLVRSGYIALIETTLLTSDSASATIDDIRRASVERHLTGSLEIVGMTDIYQSRMSKVLPLPARTISTDGSVTVVDYQPTHSRPAEYVAPERPTSTGGEARLFPPRVQLWKNALLDLSLRNSLINFSDRARFPLAVAGGNLAEFEDALNSGIGITLLPSDEIPEVQRQRGIQRGRDLPSDDRTELFRSRRELFTDSSREAYPRALRLLAYKAKTVRDETGANNLYVAIGSLVWTVKDRQVRSPLILVPVSLTTRGKTGVYTVKLDEAGASTPNYCLLEKLRAEHGLRIPALAEPVEDASGLDIDAALAGTRKALLEAGIDAYVDDTVDLAVLQFAKFRLWKDLDENWETLAENHLVRHLIDTPSDPFIDPALIDHEGNVVTDEGPVDLDALLAQLPVSADSSQLEAVSAAIAGRTFVLEGPPGTGKSQTITNLLAKAVADGKRVLFVAEKRAALDVVQRRLASVGLAPYTLDLHDKGSKPAALRLHLHAALTHRTNADRTELTRHVEGMDAVVVVLRDTPLACTRLPHRV